MTKFGIYFLLAGFFVAVFTGISKFMEAETFWDDLTIAKIIGKDYSEHFVGIIDAAAVQKALDFFIYDLPFFYVLFGIGFVLLGINLFRRVH